MITAKIKKWSMFQGYCQGEIHEDSRGRWPDGTMVTTSRIVEGPCPEGIIKTRNSTYQLCQSYKGEK